MQKVIKSKYDNLIDKCGIDGATGWSESGQQKRFWIILGQMLEVNSNSSILDFGCNIGSFSDFLVSNGANFGRYVGLDTHDKFIEFATSKYSDMKQYGNRVFVCGELASIPGKFDYTVASGPFNFKYPNCQSKTKRILGDLWDKTSKTLIANFLTTRTPKELRAPTEAGLMYFSVEEVLGWVKDMECDSFSILHDYLHNDFTLVMRREWRLFEKSES